jgi:hypothetical protein
VHHLLPRRCPAHQPLRLRASNVEWAGHVTSTGCRD